MHIGEYHERCERIGNITSKNLSGTEDNILRKWCPKLGRLPLAFSKERREEIYKHMQNGEQQRRGGEVIK